MLPWLGERFGNPSGAHRVARAARQAVDEARDAVADGRRLPARRGRVHRRRHRGRQPGRAGRPRRPARPGAVQRRRARGRARARSHASAGARCRSTAAGCVDLDALGAALDARHDAGVGDGGQQRGRRRAAGGRGGRARAPPCPGRRRPHRRRAGARRGSTCPTVLAGADLVAVSSHKVGGPQGVGALVVRRGHAAAAARALGGGQERELRSGTHNVAGIVGLAAALRGRGVATARRPRRGSGARRDRLADGLLAAVPGAGRDRRRRRDRPPARHAAPVRSRASRARRCCSCSTRPACARRPRRPAPAAPSRRRTCWRPWASRPTGAPGALRLSLGWTSTGDADVDRALDGRARPPSPGCRGARWRREGPRRHVGRGRLVGGRGPPARRRATRSWA